MGRIVKGYGLMFLSILLMGLGISIVTISNLGTTAISSLPLVLSFVFPLSFGTFTALMNIAFVIIQIMLLRKDFPKEQYLQFFMGTVLGFSIDLSMYLLSFLNTTSYFFQIVLLLIGCIIIAISIVMQLEANVVNNSGEGLVKALAIKTKKEFGNVKLYFDVCLVIIAAAISFLDLGEIIGIREGTIISALIVGPIIKIIRKVLDNRPAYISQTKDFQ